MRVLLTGATGFIGRACLPALRAAGAHIHAVARSAVSAPGVASHRADLLDPRQVAALVAEVRPTHLLHLAWIATPGVYWTSPENLGWLAASATLLREFVAQGGRRVVIAGTCAEYDWSQAGVCHEFSTPVAPSTVYGTCKHALRLVTEQFARQSGVSTAWGRIFFLYGPGEAPQRLIASTIRALLAGQPALCTSGTQRRDLLHVQDVGDALVALLRSEVGGPVNIGSGVPTPLADVVTRIGELLGRPDLVRLGARPTPSGEPPVLVADTGRLFSEVGWRPRMALDDGLAQSIDWWRSSTGV